MIATLLSLVLATAPSSASAAPAQGSDVVLDAMKDELARSMALKLSDTPAPYWASYQVVDVDGVVVTAKFGALVDSTTIRNRSIAPRVRVGDLDLDAVGVPLFDEPLVGFEDDREAMRHALWRFTDAAYKMAATRYRHELTEKAQNTADPERPAAFTTAEPVVAITPPAAVRADREALETLVRRVSAVFREHEHIRDGSVTASVHATGRRFASTDGTVVQDGSQIMTITIAAQTQADDGDILSRQIVHIVRPGEAPDAAVLEADAAKLAQELAALRAAPMIRDYSGPVLFEPMAAADLFAGLLAMQVVASGHWNGEVDAKFGQLVLPRGMDVIDDPTIDSFGGHALLGRLDIDDEGVRSERVQLVRDGKLVGLLAARAPGKKVKRSNGHARSAPYGMDIRPGATNLVITAKRGLSAAALEKKLVALVRARGAEFGLVITRGGGGYGEAPSAYRIGADGKRELVRVGHLRGLEFRQLRELAAVGKDSVVRHGLQMGGMPMPPGAAPPEMVGFTTPVSIVSPAVLVHDAEFNALAGGNPKPPAYPRPALRKR